MPPLRAAPKNKITKHKDAAAAARALQALELRKAGASYDAIARQCGYASKSGAYQAVQRELHRMMQEPADDVRTLEVARLDDLYRITYGLAIKRDKSTLWAVDRCLNIMARRAALLGLDIKVESGAGSQLAIIPVAIAADVAEAL